MIIERSSLEVKYFLIKEIACSAFFDFEIVCATCKCHCSFVSKVIPRRLHFYNVLKNKGGYRFETKPYLPKA